MGNLNKPANKESDWLLTKAEEAGVPNYSNEHHHGNEDVFPIVAEESSQGHASSSIRQLYGILYNKRGFVGGLGVPLY